MSLVGQYIGRYRILEEVGSGGMSVVYKGLDTSLEREVAVKVLHPHLARKEDSRRRLAREAKAVAKLQHPNILEIFDFAASDSETAYIVTEYIRGQTLRQYAEKGAFVPPEVAAMVIYEVAAALAHAHEAGIIHRDLKPENVMVRDDGVIKLMDFGIAKILDREDRMTMTGALVGSPAHMAPEIIEGDEVGPEADVFSLGTMLYYFSTGRLPFSGPNATATLKRILDGSYQDPRAAAPAVSDELKEIIAKCLARQPASRFSSARGLQDTLFEYLCSVGISRPTEELGMFFQDPPGCSARLTQALVENRLKVACDLLRLGHGAKALACVNQVLALDANNPQAHHLLASMNRTRRRRSALRRAIAAAVSSAAVVALCTGAFLWRGEWQNAGAADSPRAARAPESPAGAPSPTPPQTSPENPAAPVPAAPSQTLGSNRAHSLPARKPAAVAVTLLFRPYAYAQIDDGERRPETPRHEFQLAPGRHRLVYGCRFCEEETTTIDVTASGEPLRLLVQPRSSQLIFRCQPPDATVTVRGAAKTTATADPSSFEVAFPRGVTSQRLSYEIARAGFQSFHGEVSVVPGGRQVLEPRLEPE
jgi:serine/threonine-protein kinase